MFDHALRIAPHDVAILSEKAEAYTAAGDLDSSERLLQSFPADLGSEAFDDHVTIFVLRRDYPGAIKLLSEALNREAPPRRKLFARLWIAYLQTLVGEFDEAKLVFEEVQRLIEELRAKGDNSLWLRDEAIGIAAAVGDRAAVEREAEALLRVTAKDRWRLPQSEESVGRAYAMLGDAKAAIPHIERALSMPGHQTLTPAYLRLDPGWDKIRSDPRFQKLANAKL